MGGLAVIKWLDFGATFGNKRAYLDVVDVVLCRLVHDTIGIGIGIRIGLLKSIPGLIPPISAS
jgi:hypothetical protein